MVSHERIPTDLALEIGDALTPEAFLKIARAFFGYVEEVTAMVAGDPRLVGWTVVVREGSAVVGVEPSAPASAEMLRGIYAKARQGIESVARGRLNESGLPEPALKHLRVLSELSEGPKDAPIRMRVWIERIALDMTPEIGRTIDDEWRVDYRDFGSVEGRLEMIQDNHGRLQLRVRDPAMRQSIVCQFRDDMLKEVFGNFRKRVEISGVIHYGRGGRAVSIEVDRIDTFPDDDELPTAEDVRGILKSGDGRRAGLLG